MLGGFSLPEGSFKNGPVTSAGENEQLQLPVMGVPGNDIHFQRRYQKFSAPLILNLEFDVSAEERKH